MIQPTKWSVPLGSGADVQELPDDDLKFASFSKIFPQITQVPLSAGGVAPRRIDFNSLFKLLADNIYFYQNGGVFEYSDTADYEKGAIVRYNDNIYKCIQTNGASSTVVAPDSNTAYWQRLDNFVRSVNGVNADAQGNVQTGFPSDTFINVTSFPFTAPSDGWITARAVATASLPGNYVFLETKKNSGGEKLSSISARYNDTQTSTADTLPVKKGDIVNISFNSMRLISAKFFYAEGEI